MSMCFLAPAHLVIVKYKDAMYNTPKINMAVVVALFVYYYFLFLEHYQPLVNA